MPRQSAPLRAAGVRVVDRQDGAAPTEPASKLVRWFPAVPVVTRAHAPTIEDELRGVATTVAGRARARAPVYTGKLQRSIRPSVTVKRGAAVTSSVPYAGVHEFGGVIYPRGVPIEIKARRMVTGAISESDAALDRAVERMGDAIERAWAG